MRKVYAADAITLQSKRNCCEFSDAYRNSTLKAPYEISAKFLFRPYSILFVVLFPLWMNLNVRNKFSSSIKKTHALRFFFQIIQTFLFYIILHILHDFCIVSFLLSRANIISLSRRTESSTENCRIERSEQWHHWHQYTFPQGERRSSVWLDFLPSRSVSEPGALALHIPSIVALGKASALFESRQEKWNERTRIRPLHSNSLFAHNTWHDRSRRDSE